MKIIADRPPNFEDIAWAFKGAYGEEVVFAYAPNIYYPDAARGKKLPGELIAHEAAHIRRQEEMGVTEWWSRYIEDADFRMEEEIIAHVAEYEFLIANATSRQQRRGSLKAIGRKLSSPLYRYNLSLKQAMKLLEERSA